ncbi:MAG: inorganic phosphate transporter [candidate division Zixibacteria bacterium]|nr:inorganic phosphate transporter [candidate division Zixibacteria bacterium]
MFFIYLSSGLFLGWSLGANDAANVFGTAVGSKMLRLRTVAIICGIFVILGAVISGAGPTQTLKELGAVDAMAGSFMVALSAAFTVWRMTKLKIPVSTSQAIVGAIIGWNLYTNSPTDLNSLTKIVLTWIVCPVLAALLSMVIYLVVRLIVNKLKIHLLRLDTYNRVGLIIVGAFGSYSLGANNIANVMGVFIPVSPFKDTSLLGINISGAQQLFFIGGVAIAVGAYTYSHKVIDTVGKSLMKISPVSALVVVLSQALVLFIFASERLRDLLVSYGLPPLPLVPVSSSQAIVGAIIGLGILKGGRGLRYRVLGEISLGWLITPVMAGIIAFVSLFFLQNVFKMEINSTKVSDVRYNNVNPGKLHRQTNIGQQTLVKPAIFTY